MSKETLRIEIPIHRPDDFLRLCTSVSAKHDADPAASPLDPAMMATFAANLITAEGHRQTGLQQHNLGQSRLGASVRTLGFAKHQNSKTPGTLNNLLLQVRDSLDIANRQNPEATSEWGFDVQVNETGGRVTVKYVLPTNHDNFLDLADSILAKHLADGPSSPLSGLDMATFDTLRQQARTERNEGKAAHALAESENGAAEVVMGRAEHQNSRSEGTLYYDLLLIRDSLKIAMQQNPEEMSTWGFNVVVGSAAVGRKATANVDMTLTGSEPGNPPLADVHVFEQTTGEDIGDTDIDGKLRDENQLTGIRRYEFSAEGRDSKVVETELQKGENQLDVEMDPAP